VDGQLDQIVLGDLEAIGREAEVLGGDGELAAVRRLILGVGEAAGVR